MRTLGTVCATAVLSFGAGEGHGGEITVAPTLVDFGPVSVAGPPVMNVVVITNTGSPTFVNGLLLGGCNGFGATGAFPAQLGSGESMIVNVAFDPPARGPFNCNITIQDGDTNADTFQLTGVGTAPFLVVTSPTFPNPLNFADQPWDGGVVETLYVDIQNTGNEAIQASNFFATLSGGAHFSVGSPTFPIAPGAHALVPISFDPASEGEKSDALTMALNNDLPGDPNGIVLLSGTGTSPTTDVDPLAGPAGLRLLGSNPVTKGTRFSYSTAERGRVKLALFDMSGRLVQGLHDEIEEAGPHEWAWSRVASGTPPSGVYLVRLSLTGRTLGTSRVVVLRGLQ